jgi:hypothetical protein
MKSGKTIIQLQVKQRTKTYVKKSETIFFPCGMRFTPDVGKRIELFCHKNLEFLGLKDLDERYTNN